MDAPISRLSGRGARFRRWHSGRCGAWLVLCCRALQAGAQEALSIAEALPRRSAGAADESEKCEAGGDPK